MVLEAMHLLEESEGQVALLIGKKGIAAVLPLV